MGNLSLQCDNSKAVTEQLEALSGDIGSQVERLLVCMSRGDIAGTTELFSEGFALRMFNQTERSYTSVTEKASVRSVLEWLFGHIASQTFLVKKKLADEASTKVSPTAFFAWESGLVNGSCVCVFLPGSTKLHRLHVVLQCTPNSSTKILPHITQGDDMLSRIRAPLGEGEPGAKTTFTHHFSTFGKGATPVDGRLPDAATTAQEQMKDFSEKAVLHVYNHVTNKHDARSDATSILDYFTHLYPTFTDISALDAPMWEVEEQTATSPGIVFLAWRCPSSGYISGTDTFVLDSNHKIIKQYVVDVKV